MQLLVLAALVLGPGAQAEPSSRPCAYMEGRLSEGTACQGVERAVLGRSYCVHRPAAPKTGLPVVLLLHGYSSNGESQAHYFDLDSAVERRGFILVKPNGTLDGRGSRYWNSGAHSSQSGPDDVAYLTAVLSDVLTTFSADAKRIFIVGHSNGAFMANRLACERSERIAAIVSLAGAVDGSSCHPTVPVSVLTVHGTSDRLVRYSGGSGAFLGTYASADDTLAVWAKLDGCSGARVVGKPLHLTCEGAVDTVASGYSGCPTGIAVEHWKLEDTGHIPNFALPAWPDGVIDFLWAHPKAKGPK